MSPESQQQVIARITVELEGLAERLRSPHPPLSKEERGRDAITCESAAQLLVVLQDYRTSVTHMIDNITVGNQR